MDKKKDLEERYHSIVNEAFQFVKAEIIEACDAERLKFTTMYMFKITAEDGELDEHPLKDLIFWYEDTFGLFPQVYYDSETKKWFDGTVESVE